MGTVREWARAHNARFLHVRFSRIPQEDHVSVARDIARRPAEFYGAVQAAFQMSLPPEGNSHPPGLWEHVAERMAADVEFVAGSLEVPGSVPSSRCCVCAQMTVTGLPTGGRLELYGFNMGFVPHCPCP